MRTHRGHVISLLLLLGGCARNHQSALDPTGAQAATIYSLFMTFVWVTSIIYVLVLLSVGYVIFRGRSEEPLAIPPAAVPSAQSERRSTYTVAALVALTIIILFVLLIADFSSNRTMAALRGKSDLQITVTGHQWWWQARYDDPVAQNVFVTANEIHIPTGTVIRFNLESNDVIHSFWVPELHGKKDLIPGHPTSIWLKADKEGTYEGQCAEFCGAQHAHMRFLVVAESREKFDAWQVAARRPAPEPVYANEKHGKQVFLGGTCVMCHTIAGTSAGGGVGPDLTHVASRLSLGAGTIPNNPGHLAGWIIDPQRIKPGVRMPQHTIPPNDLRDLLAYLETLK
jgi:cytochrome c oxidase subunit 2